MNKDCLVAMFEKASDLRTGLETLDKAKFDSTQVSVITRREDDAWTELAEASDTTPASPPSEKTMGVSTLAGGTLGAVVGTATMIGPFLVAGPLVGMAAGAAAGSCLSAVESWGVDHDVAARYDEVVKQGGGLVFVNSEGEAKLDQAERLLKTCGPTSLERFKK